MAGYSHRSLRDKLDIKPGMSLYFDNAPLSVLTELGSLKDDTPIVHAPHLANYLHFFITTYHELQQITALLKDTQDTAQIIWVSWPKKTSKVETEISEQDLRDALLPVGLVDIKVCAVSDIYSGLKFVWRKK